MSREDSFSDLCATWDAFFGDQPTWAFASDRPLADAERASIQGQLDLRSSKAMILPHGVMPMPMARWTCEYCGNEHASDKVTCWACGARR